MSEHKLTKPQAELLKDLQTTTRGGLLLSCFDKVVTTLVRHGFIEPTKTMGALSKVDIYRLTEKGREWGPKRTPVCPLCDKGIQRFERRVMVQRDGRKVHAHAMCSREARSVFL